ncbi:threonine ammonia-lyase [Silvibacterium dinghuense]|uniref:Threonine/serine dehydratase n=1 Tax=Silvibacterium dinghuense TaxID=1560006 RepID=A0A4Q1SBH9_9BACT|nr:threonine/serine dehydratase [Silvibacterium dinghuense]RXS94491.1 threonine/serine dehydratase [Silvibacterium dinghuense]GGH15760.1 serine/threonine dehydratase [Silvibacterium dinghuense]
MASATSTTSLVTLDTFRAAQERIRGVAVHTPLIPFSLPGGSSISAWLKDESKQPIKSFKLRGAYNKIAQLSDEERRRGVITYSSGNHAQGVAYAARAVGAKAVIVMPSNAPEIKKQATLALGAEIVTVGPSSSDRKIKAEELEREHGYVMIPPYDHPAIIAGQGTVGLEILADIPDVDLVLAPVSGGGLLSGTAAAIKHLRPEVRVLGIEPALAADAEESFRGGSLVSWPAEMTTRTIADGLRTQSLGDLNFLHVRAFVDDIVTVTEDEIREAMRTIVRSTPIVPEPSGAVTAAALLFHQDKLLPAVKAVAVMSGGNVEPEILKQVMES